MESYTRRSQGGRNQADTTWRCHLLCSERKVSRQLKELNQGKARSRKSWGTVDLPKISSPNEVTLDIGSSPIVYITDPPSKAIFKYNTSGKLLGTIDLQSVGLQRPAGIAYADGYLLIVDLGGHCIFKLDPEGMFVGKIGSYGDQLGCLNQPYGIAVLPNGLFAVTEMGNHRVSVFNTEGQFETCFGNKGRSPGMFTTPKGISANSTHLVVVDYGNKRFQVFEIRKISI